MEEAAADVKPGEQTKLPGADKKPPHKGIPPRERQKRTFFRASRASS